MNILIIEILIDNGIQIEKKHLTKIMLDRKKLHTIIIMIFMIFLNGIALIYILINVNCA